MTDARGTTDTQDRDVATQEQPAPPAPARVLLAVFCLALLLGGFGLMAWAFDAESSVMFTAGILVSGAAFFVPMHRPGL